MFEKMPFCQYRYEDLIFQQINASQDSLPFRILNFVSCQHKGRCNLRGALKIKVNVVLSIIISTDILCGRDNELQCRS